MISIAASILISLAIGFWCLCGGYWYGKKRNKK